MYEELAVPARPCPEDDSPVVDASEDGPAVAEETESVARRLISKRVVRVGGAAAIATLALSVGYLAIRFAPRLAELATYGYFGIFALMVVSGGTVFFPVPGMASVFVAGAVWNPLLVGLAAGLGNSIGELTGYIAGRSGRTLLNADERPFFQRADRFLRRYGFFALVAFAAIPNPVFDVVGIAAGCLGYSVKRFWLAVAIGNTVKYGAMALLASVAYAPLSDLVSRLLPGLF